MDFTMESQIQLNKTLKSFDALYYREWFARNWHLSIYASIAYMICIANGQKWMKYRKPYDLKNVIFLWNICLSFFSFCGTIKLMPELVSVISNNGLYYSICNDSFKNDPTIEYWIWLFTWSKLIEFGDTVFIVLRKQRLICLHWSHHVITFVYCFYVYSDLPAISRWGIAINYLIHAIMYLYYALKTIRISIPEVVSKSITTLQTIQMLIGIMTGSSAIYFVSIGRSCDGTVTAMLATTAMSFYYFILFANYFVNRYQRKSRLKSD